MHNLQNMKIGRWGGNYIMLLPAKGGLETKTGTLTHLKSGKIETDKTSRRKCAGMEAQWRINGVPEDPCSV